MTYNMPIVYFVLCYRNELMANSEPLWTQAIIRMITKCFVTPQNIIILLKFEIIEQIRNSKTNLFADNQNGV